MPSPSPIVAVSRALPGTVEIPKAEIRRGPERKMPREEFLRFIQGASVLVTWV